MFWVVRVDPPHDWERFIGSFSIGLPPPGGSEPRLFGVSIETPNKVDWAAAARGFRTPVVRSFYRNSEQSGLGCRGPGIPNPGCSEFLSKLRTRWIGLSPCEDRCYSGVANFPWPPGLVLSNPPGSEFLSELRTRGIGKKQSRLYGTKIHNNNVSLHFSQTARIAFIQSLRFGVLIETPNQGDWIKQIPAVGENSARRNSRDTQKATRLQVTCGGLHACRIPQAGAALFRV